MAGRNQAATQANTKHSKIVGIRSQGQMSGSPFSMISSPLPDHILVSCVFKVFCFSTFSEKRKASFCYNLGLLLQLDISECSVHQQRRVYHLLQGSPKIASGKLLHYPTLYISQ